MRTYLGASLKMGASHFDENVERLAFGDDDGPGESNANKSKSKSDAAAAPGGRDRASLLHVEGYTLYRPDLARAARGAWRLVSRAHTVETPARFVGAASARAAACR